MKYQVIEQHRSEFPNPIIVTKGDKLIVGEKSDENEIWNNWYLCETQHHVTGWVPGQIIKMLSDNEGEVLEDYSAKEMDVDVNDQLVGTRELNGWIWCQNLASNEEGWVPAENLKRI